MEASKGSCHVLYMTESLFYIYGYFNLHLLPHFDAAHSASIGSRGALFEISLCAHASKFATHAFPTGII